MNKKINIAFVGDVSSSFVERDYEILKKYFVVRVIQPPNKRPGWLKHFFIVAKEVKQCDVTFSWLAWWHSAAAVFFSKLFRKKSLVVVGGHGAANVPELKYGAFINIKGRLPVSYIYKNANKVLVVDLSLKKSIIKNVKINGDNITCLPTGYDADFWKSKGRKKNSILTIAAANDIQRVKLKGLDTFVNSARDVPDVKFIVVGVKNEAKKYLEKISSKNVELVEFLPENELLPYYQMAKVYCQLSLREGLPNTLCEAMLCECIPVGTKFGGIPTAMGDTGFYVPYGDAKTTAKAIKKALEVSDERGKKARNRIKNMFPLEQRENELVEIIRNLVGK